MSRSFRVAPDIRYRVIDEEAVVVRQREGDVLVLNQVAARVLQLVGQGLSPTEIGDRVTGEFEAPEAVIREDIDLLRTIPPSTEQGPFRFRSPSAPT